MSQVFIPMNEDAKVVWMYTNTFDYFSEYIIDCFDRNTKPVNVSISVKVNTNGTYVIK